MRIVASVTYRLEQGPPRAQGMHSSAAFAASALVAPRPGDSLTDEIALRFPGCSLIDEARSSQIMRRTMLALCRDGERGKAGAPE